MLLATVPSLTVRGVLRDGPSGERTAYGSDAFHDTYRPFAGIEDWPQLNRLLHRSALELIANRGVASWLSAGGIRAADGSPSFGDRSDAAGEILSQIAARTGALRFTDNEGMQWALILVPDSRGRIAFWRGVAVGGESSPTLLSHRVRENTLQQIARHLAELDQPALRRIEDVDDDRMRLTRWQHRIRMLDVALRVLPGLRRSAVRQRTGRVTVPAVTLAAAA
jgi:hypothetical protein